MHTIPQVMMVQGLHLRPRWQVLQLHKSDDDREIATFLHQKGRVYDIAQSAEAVREEIEAETDRSLGPGKARRRRGRCRKRCRGRE